jgi:DNA-directed RNA polymerase subunit alpha
MRLDARGPATVTAGDIECPPTSRSSTPDCHIATLNGKGRLAIDLTVERGRGYVSSRPQQEPHIGVIPIDSIFSPGPPGGVRGRADPRRAVDRTTTASSRHRDRRLDHPAEALASAGATLRSLVELVAR